MDENEGNLSVTASSINTKQGLRQSHGLSHEVRAVVGIFTPKQFTREPSATTQSGS